MPPDEKEEKEERRDVRCFGLSVPAIPKYAHKLNGHKNKVNGHEVYGHKVNGHEHKMVKRERKDEGKGDDGEKKK